MNGRQTNAMNAQIWVKEKKLVMMENARHITA